ncbi:MAG: alginate lyase family protein, partial [Chloroflexota bacterium]
MRALHISIAIVISIVITSSIVWVAPNIRAADEPNVFMNASQIAAVKAQIQAGNQPWAASFDRLKKDADDALNKGPYSVSKNGGPNGGHNYRTEQPYCGWKRVDGKDPDCRDGKINPQADRQDYQEAIDIGAAVRDLGLAYAFTDDERYAERAAYLIRVWALDADTRMEPRYTDGQSNIELSITMPGLFYGADLISTSASWPESERRAFEQWTRDFVSSGRSWTGSNNFEWWRLVTVASGGAFLDDAETLDYAFDRYEKVMPDHVGEDGQMVKELGRTKSLMYSLYSLNAMTQIAEIARHNGRNLYDYTSGGNSLKQALDYHAPYATDQSSWGRQQIAPIEAKDVAHYEMAYAYFGDQAYLDTLDEWGRPLYERRTMGWVSLTHAAQGGDIVINPPTDPDPTPEPGPDPTPEPDPTVFGL